MSNKLSYEELEHRVKVLEKECDTLKSEMENYRLILESSYDVPFSISMDGTITYVGPQIKYFGYEVAEVVSKNYLDFIPIEQHAQVAEKIRENIKTRQNRTVEAIWLGKNGTDYWVETIGKNIYNEEGQIIGRIGVMRDISERKKTELSLKENEEKFRLIAENSGEGVWQLDLDGNLIYALIPKNKIFGYTDEEVLSLRFYDFFHESEHKRVHDAFNRAVAGEPFQLLELTGIKKDGAHLPLEVTITPLIRNETIEGVQGIVRNITERKKIQNEIQRQKTIESELSKLATYLLTATQIPDISYEVLETARKLIKSRYGYVGVIDADKREFMGHAMNRDAWNDCKVENKSDVFEAHAKLWGTGLKKYEPMVDNYYGSVETSVNLIPSGHFDIQRVLSVPAMIGEQQVGQLVLANPETPFSVDDMDLAERITTLFTMAIQRQKYESALIEAEAQKKDELEDMVYQRTSELENTKNNLEKEIKQRKKMEQDLVQADKMISLGILVSGVAHEINNPNNFIMLNAPLLKDVWESVLPLLEEQYSENGDFMVAGLPYSEMKLEVPHLLNGIEEGSRRIQRIVKDLKEYSRRDKEAMEDAVSVNDVVQQSVKLLNPMIKKATQHFSVSYGQDLPPIKGNSQKLSQVVINLIQNACQALDDDEKSIRVSTTMDDGRGDVSIIVEDEGRGIPEDILPHIMDPFFTTKRDTGGTGLGLAVSANIIEEHGGKIEIYSEANRKSVFKICLPTQEKAIKKKILVVDDDKALREMIYKALNKKGRYNVQKVSSGTEASVRLGIEKPDLVILDMQMPDMNGVEICRLIKVSPELSGIKVLIVTGYPSSSKVKEAGQLGFHHMLAKPFQMGEFYNALENILEENNTVAEE